MPEEVVIAESPSREILLRGTLLMASSPVCGGGRFVFIGVREAEALDFLHGKLTRTLL